MEKRMPYVKLQNYLQFNPLNIMLTLMLLEGIPSTQRSLSGKPSQVVLKCNRSVLGKEQIGIAIKF